MEAKGWQVRRLKYVASMNDNVLAETTDPDHEMQYIDISNVDSLGHISEATTYKFDKAPSRARRVVKHGDVIISTVRTYLQAIAAIEDPPENLIVSTGFAVVRPREYVLVPGFCKYALREPRFLDEVEARSTGVSYPSIASSELADIELQLPPLPTQRRIADYLDAETQRIDELIAAKRSMLALLEKKRAALVSQAVTKGLSPKAKMKDSGLEWLGEIPEHWGVRKLKHLCRHLETGSTPARQYMEDPDAAEFHWYTPGDFGEELRLGASRRRIPVDAVEKGEVRIFPPCAVLVVSIGATLGRVGLTDREASANQQINALHGWDDVEPEYVLNVLSGGSEMLKSHSVASTLAILNQDKLGSIRIPFPPLSEQQAINAFCAQVESSIKPIESEIDNSITLLVSRRSALITAAVTGQVGVADQAISKSGRNSGALIGSTPTG